MVAHHQSFFLSENIWGIKFWHTFLLFFFTIHAFDRREDGQTDRQTDISLMAKTALHRCSAVKTMSKKKMNSKVMSVLFQRETSTEDHTNFKFVLEIFLAADDRPLTNLVNARLMHARGECTTTNTTRTMQCTQHPTRYFTATQ